MSFAAQLIKTRALVYDIRMTQADGRQVFLIVEIAKSKHAAFRKLLDSGADFDLLDYGTVLHAGFGAPGEALQAELREKYGMYQEQ